MDSTQKWHNIKAGSYILNNKEMNYTFISTTRGGRVLVYLGHMYYDSKRMKKSGSTCYKCIKSKGLYKNCSARIYFDGVVFEDLNLRHSHPADVAGLERKLFISRLKERVSAELEKSVPQIYREEYARGGTTPNASQYFPPFTSLENVLYRARKLVTARNELENDKEQSAAAPGERRNTRQSAARPEPNAEQTTTQPTIIKTEVFFGGLEEPILEVNFDDDSAPGQSPTSEIPLWPTIESGQSDTNDMHYTGQEDFDETEDEFNLFSKHISCQLRQLPLKRALHCQDQINSLLVKERLDYLASKSKAPSRNCSQINEVSSATAQNRFAEIPEPAPCRIVHVQGSDTVLSQKRTRFNLPWLGLNG